MSRRLHKRWCQHTWLHSSPRQSGSVNVSHVKKALTWRVEKNVTWKTQSIASQKLSNVLLGFSSRPSPLNLPPKTCIPSRANITMNRKRRTRRLTMARIELIRETTRFRSEVQYLFGIEIVTHEKSHFPAASLCLELKFVSHTSKMRQDDKSR